MVPPRKASFGALAGLLAMLASLAAPAATPVPPGKWSFTFQDARGRADRPIRVYTYRPPRCQATCPIVFVLHGARRNAYDYIAHWELAADRHDFLVVAPEFSGNHWPGAAAYNLGDVAAQPDPGKRAFAALEHLFDEVRDGQADYAVFGHGAGAQFVQRMALYHPGHRARVLVAANPGWYTMPEWRADRAAAPFPYSMAGSPAGEAELRRALARRLLVLAAERDDEPDPDKLGAGAAAKKQGEGGIDRAENFFKAATAAAAELGVRLGWELHEVADGHDAAAMSRAAARILYPSR